MKNLKSYQSFTVHETMDMMTLPRDPQVGAKSVYKDIIDVVSSKLDVISNSLKKVASPDVDKIKNFMEKNFGTASPDYNEKNVRKFQNILGSDSNFSENKNSVSEICSRVNKVMGINMDVWGSKLLSFLLNSVSKKRGSGDQVFENENPLGGIMLWAWILFWIFKKIMKLFGHSQEEKS